MHSIQTHGPYGSDCGERQGSRWSPVQIQYALAAILYYRTNITDSVHSTFWHIPKYRNRNVASAETYLPYCHPLAVGLTSSGYLTPMTVWYVSLDTLALLGRIRPRFCRWAKPAAASRVVAIGDGTPSPFKASHKIAKQVAQTTVSSQTSSLPKISHHNCITAVMCSDSWGLLSTSSNNAFSWWPLSKLPNCCASSCKQSCTLVIHSRIGEYFWGVSCRNPPPHPMITCFPLRTWLRFCNPTSMHTDNVLQQPAPQHSPWCRSW